MTVGSVAGGLAAAVSVFLVWVLVTGLGVGLIFTAIELPIWACFLGGMAVGGPAGPLSIVVFFVAVEWIEGRVS